MGTHISVIMPAYDEAPNLAEVIPRTVAVLDASGASFEEVVVVDDGSTDATRSLLRQLAEAHPTVRSRRCGATAARRPPSRPASTTPTVRWWSSWTPTARTTRGNPCLLDALAAGIDLVSGRRLVRHDRMVKRTTSKLYNRVTAGVTGVSGRDFNSGLKAMTRSAADALELYVELHRYVPVLAAWAGFSVTEVDVAHHARLRGTSQFDRSRFWRRFLDLLTVKFLTTYTRPAFHLFGNVGVVTGLLGTVLLAGWECPS